MSSNRAVNPDVVAARVAANINAWAATGAYLEVRGDGARRARISARKPSRGSQAHTTAQNDGRAGPPLEFGQINLLVIRDDDGDSGAAAAATAGTAAAFFVMDGQHRCATMR